MFFIDSFFIPSSIRVSLKLNSLSSVLSYLVSSIHQAKSKPQEKSISGIINKIELKKDRLEKSKINEINKTFVTNIRRLL